MFRVVALRVDVGVLEPNTAQVFRVVDPGA